MLQATQTNRRALNTKAHTRSFIFLFSWLFLSFVTGYAQVLTGYTKVDASVGENGDAKAVIPINTPKGTFVQPSLSLVYSSHGSDGLLGPGFTLEGAFQVISRVPATDAQDGFSDGVDFDGDDRFALNGERIMVRGGATYGADGATYYTEQHTFSKIVSYGNTGFGPQRFKVWTKDGLILDFGATNDSRIEMQGTTDRVLTWLLNRVEDVSGNYMTISYAEDNTNGEFRPTEINYTGNSRTGRIPYNRIQFFYASRVNVFNKYLEGYKSRTTKRLTSIEVRDHSDFFRRYALNYVVGTDKLNGVTEYGFDNTSSLKSVQLTWAAQPATAAFNEIGGGFWDAHNLGPTNNFPADFNGDGKTDFAAWESGTNWRVSLSTGSSFKPAALWQANDQGSNSEIGDFNGDGKADLIAYVSNGNWTVSLSTGNGFNTSTWQGHTGGKTNNLIGDFNGDGRSDIATPISGGNNWKICLSTGTNFNILIWAGGPTQPSSECFAGDFNGDGKTDIIGNKTNGNWAIAISSGNGFITATWASNVTNKKWTNMCDLNGDGLTDLASWSTSGVWNISLSNGKGFTTETWTGHNGDSTNNFAGDYNGDGKTDFAKFEGASSWKICLSTGAGFIIQVWVDGNPYGNNNNLIGDFNGDGFSDLCAFYSGTNWYIKLSNQEKDFITKIRNGNGVEYNFLYAPLTDTMVYRTTLIGSTTQYPYADFNGSLYVVKMLSTHDALGNAGARRIFYKYWYAKFNLAGRGFRGFGQMETLDTIGNVRQVSVFERDYQCISTKLRSSRTYTVDGKLISSVDNEIAMVPVGDNSCFSFYNRTTERQFELSGQEYLTKITKYNYDRWGNLIFSSEVYNNSYVVQTNNLYNDDTVNWKLGRLTESVVTKTLSGKASSVKKSSFTYNTDGLLVREVSLPDMADLRIQTDYMLDGSGNRTKTIITGPDFSPRTDSLQYDDDGRFVIKTMNALGHTVTANYTNGLLSSNVDANGYVTIIARDNFGRETNIQNGTNINEQFYTNKTYDPCSAGCPAGTVYVITEQDKGEGLAKTYFDLHDRPLRKEAIGFGNRKVLVDYQYNADGTEKAVSDPYYEGDTKVWTNHTYDALKRLSVEEQPGNRKNYVYYNGLSKSSVNALGQRNTRIENAMGKLVQVIDNNGNSLYYDYDSELNLLAVKDPLGNETRLTYNLRGDKLTMKDPDMGFFKYRYDGLGLLKSQTTPAGDSASFEYDALNRMKKRTEKEGTTEWFYDPASCLGKVSSIVQTQGSIIYTNGYSYLRDGRMLGMTLQKNAEPAKQFSYTYNTANNKLASESYPSGLTVNYAYDALGYLTNVYNPTNNYQYWQANAYNAEGQLTVARLGNGLTTRKTFDLNTGYLKQIQTGTGTTGAAVYDRQNLQFTFNDIGNLTERKDVAKALSETFRYDGLNRLTAAQVGAKAPLTIRYDVLGNITYKSDVGKYFYGENGAGPHQLTRIDHAGISNCFDKLNQAVTYNSYNYAKQLKNETTTIDILYGPERERRELTLTKNGVVKMQKTYWGGVYEQGKDSINQTTETWYIKAGGDVVAAFSKTGSNTEKLSYFHTDHLGSVVATSDGSTGAIEQEYNFDAWGRARNPLTWDVYATPQGTPKFQRGYTFHEMLDMDFLVCMNARIYNPVLGRFLSADPFVPFPDDLQSMNRYSYVHNNPLSFTDPSGHFLKWIFKKVKRFIVPVVRIALTIITAPLGPVVSGAIVGFGTAFTNALVNGGNFGQALQAGFQGAVSGALNGAIGAITAGISSAIGQVFDGAHSSFNGLDLFKDINFIDNPGAYLFRLAGNGVIDGVKSVVQGGSFKDGFKNSIKSNVKGALTNFLQENKTNYFNRVIGWLEKNNPLDFLSDKNYAYALYSGVRQTTEQLRDYIRGSYLENIMGAEKIDDFQKSIINNDKLKYLTYFNGYPKTGNTLLIVATPFAIYNISQTVKEKWNNREDEFSNWIVNRLGKGIGNYVKKKIY
jgi:RHS repeat-associated protein